MINSMKVFLGAAFMLSADGASTVSVKRSLTSSPGTLRGSLFDEVILARNVTAVRNRVADLSDESIIPQNMNEQDELLL